MSTPNPLSPRSLNTPTPPTTTTASPPSPQPSTKEPQQQNNAGAEPQKTMAYHRQVLQSKLSQDSDKQNYVSPSDTIMSPCTAKLSAYKSKHFGKAKPQSLFAKTASKGLEGGKDGVNEKEGGEVGGEKKI